MKADLRDLALRFIERTGATIDPELAAAALAEILAELSAPRTENEIRKRRLTVAARPFFMRYERETGVTRAQITAPTTGGGGHVDPLTAHRDAFVATLIESRSPRFSLGEVSAIVGRNRAAVRKAYARHEARLRSAVTSSARVRRAEGAPF